MNAMPVSESVPFLIKICGITNLRDARMALEAGADALGFVFYQQSPRYITAQAAREIIESTRPRFAVGVFVSPTSEDLLMNADTSGINVAQVYGGSGALPVRTGVRIWRALAPGQAAPDNNVDAYLIDTPAANHGGSGKTFDWTLAAEFPHRKIIAGGLHAGNVAEAIRMTCPWGVDACSCLESDPGKKDPQRVRDFIEAARQAFELQLAHARTL